MTSSAPGYTAESLISHLSMVPLMVPLCVQVVVANIDTYLSAAAGEQYNVLRNTLWRTIEDEITPKGQ